MIIPSYPWLPVGHGECLSRIMAAATYLWLTPGQRTFLSFERHEAPKHQGTRELFILKAAFSGWLLAPSLISVDC